MVTECLICNEMTVTKGVLRQSDLPQTAVSASVYNLQGSISFSFKDISSLLRSAILKSSIYFNIGFKLNGNLFSTYDS